MFGMWMPRLINWRKLVGLGKQPRKGRRGARCATPFLEALEDRRLLSGGMSISHMSNNNWTAGLADFTGAMTITGGVAPYTVVDDANLPASVTPVVHGNLVEFTGAPSVAKTFSNCQVTVEDSVGNLASKTFVIDVEPALLLGNLTISQWTVGEANYPASITITGGTGAVTLASSSGLPTGLGVALNGRVIDFTGAPTAVGTFEGSVTVQDSDGATATSNFTITINPTLTLGTLSPLAWTGMEPGYPGTISITGGTAPYTIGGYGSLPFTPIVHGDAVYFEGLVPSQTLVDGTISVIDAAGATATETIPSFRINVQPTVARITEGQWTVNQPGFNGTMTINYGTAPFTILDSKNLPTGLTPIINGSEIEFTGTPTGARAFNSGMITLEDSGGATVTTTVDITINPAPAITTASLPALNGSASYNATVKSTGGTGTLAYTLTGGSLPPGLSLSSSGKISGASSATTAYTFQITVTDIVGATASQTFTIAGGAALAVSTLTQPQWTIGQPNYHGTMTVSGGTGSYALTGATGLPPGLSATLSGSTITITGLPTQIGVFNTGSIVVTDSGNVNITVPISITIAAAPKLGTLAVTAWTGGVGGFPGTIAITGGTGPFTITNSRDLPFTPVISGNTIIFTGSAGAGNYPNESITVVDAAGAGATESLPAITINPQATLTNLSVNNWTAGLGNFPGTATLDGGTEPFTVVQSKNVPPGMTPVVVGQTLEFKGTPTSGGLFDNVIITLQDAAGVQKIKSFVINLAPLVEITNTSLPAWHSGVDYSAQLSASGGTGGDTFTITAGALPPGLTLKPKGLITGLATGVGTYTFTVTVMDSLGATSSETFTL